MTPEQEAEILAKREARIEADPQERFWVVTEEVMAGKMFTKTAYEHHMAGAMHTSAKHRDAAIHVLEEAIHYLKGFGHQPEEDSFKRFMREHRERLKAMSPEERAEWDASCEEMKRLID